MTPKLLLLEGDAMRAAELTRGLRAAGCDVTLVRDGAAGLARAVSEAFDVVVAAADLPRTNGFRVCSRIKKDANAGAIPVVLLDAEGAGAADLAEHAKLPTRADAYVYAPVTLDDVVAALRALVPEFVPAAVERGAAAVARKLERELVAAQEELGAVLALRAKLAEQEARNAALARELAQARASMLRGHGHAGSDAPSPAADPDETAPPDSTPTVRVDAPPSLVPVRPSKREVLADRQRLAVAEASVRALENAARERAAQLSRTEKLLASARADKEQWSKRAEENAKRLERVRADLEQARQAVTREKEAHAAELARRAAAHATDSDASKTALAAARREVEEVRAALARARAEAQEAKQAADERAARLEASAGAAEHRRASEAARAADEAKRAREELAAEKSAREGAETERAWLEAELAASSVRFEQEMAAARAGAETTHEQRLAEVRRAHEAEMAKVRDASDSRAQELEARLLANDAAHEKVTAEAARAAAEARAALVEDHEIELAALQGDLDRAARILLDRDEHVAALESALARSEERNAELAGRVSARSSDDARRAEALGRRLRDVEAALDRARREREEEARESDGRVDALQALLASRGEEVERLLLELERDRLERSALEAEIVVMRSEMMSVRRELEREAIAAAAATAQLERDRALLERARKVVAELAPSAGGDDTVPSIDER